MIQITEHKKRERAGNQKTMAKKASKKAAAKTVKNMAAVAAVQAEPDLKVNAAVLGMLGETGGTDQLTVRAELATEQVDTLIKIFTQIGDMLEACDSKEDAASIVLTMRAVAGAKLYTEVKKAVLSLGGISPVRRLLKEVQADDVDAEIDADEEE